TQKINAEAKAAAEAEGFAFGDHPAMKVIDTLVNDFDRKGKAAGAGFYEYPDEGKKYLWPGLWDSFVREDVALSLADIQERMTCIMAIETVRCLEEGVLRTVADANIGSIMGIGFPPVYGGALQYIDGYDGGAAGFVERAREFESAYGDRFAPPKLLLDK